MCLLLNLPDILIPMRQVSLPIMRAVDALEGSCRQNIAWTSIYASWQVNLFYSLQIELWSNLYVCRPTSVLVTQACYKRRSLNLLCVLNDEEQR